MTSHNSTSNSSRSSLSILQGLMQRGIQLPAKISFDSFLIHEEIRAAKVRQYRKFAYGEHDVELSQEMKDMLRADNLILNQCENILETLSDRIRLSNSNINATVNGEDGEPDEEATTEANKWIESLTQSNRLDGMQIDVHDATPRDGMGFVLAEYSEAEKRVVWTVEPAYDGHSGVVVIWGSDRQELTMGIKLWHETQVGNKSELVDHVRINLYFPNRIEKYIVIGGELNQFKDKNGEWRYDWILKDGSPIGVAIIPFVYKSTPDDRFGLGRLENVIPVQRAVNRVFNSLIMTSENIGFPIRYSLGMPVPTTIRPGTWITAVVPDTIPIEGGKTRTLSAAEKTALMEAIVKVRIGQIESADLGGLLNELGFMIAQMYIISGTPYPEGTGANMSGEALKQLDIRLIGTIQRCQTSWGNSWEELIKLSARIETVFGGGAPWSSDTTVINAEWVSAELRNDKIIIETVKATIEIVPNLDTLTRLEMVAGIYKWTPSRIKEITERIIAQQSADAASERAFGTENDGFEEFGNGIDLGDPLNPDLTAESAANGNT